MYIEGYWVPDRFSIYNNSLGDLKKKDNDFSDTNLDSLQYAVWLIILHYQRQTDFSSFKFVYL